MEKFYDAHGAEVLSLHQLTSQNYGEVNSETQSAHGCFVLKDHFIYMKNILVEMEGLEYEIPHGDVYETMEITDDSKCRFVVKDSSGDVIRFITDEKIKEYRFDEQGKVIAP